MECNSIDHRDMKTEKKLFYQHLDLENKNSHSTNSYPFFTRDLAAARYFHSY